MAYVGSTAPPRTIEVMEVSFKEPPAPRALREARAPSRPFPIDALSFTLQRTVNTIEDLIQCPTALAAMSVLSAASLAVQGHANVLIPATNQARPLSLFLLSIAESDERKSSADNEALKPVKEYERQFGGIARKAIRCSKMIHVAIVDPVDAGSLSRNPQCVMPVQPQADNMQPTAVECRRDQGFPCTVYPLLQTEPATRIRDSRPDGSIRSGSESSYTSKPYVGLESGQLVRSR
jgi:hypothetical protein